MACVLCCVLQRWRAAEYAALLNRFERPSLYILAGCFLASLASAEAWLYLANADLFRFEAEVGSFLSAFQFMQGEPIYHAPEAAERYTLLYGPLLSVLYGSVLAIAPNMTAHKCLGVLFLLAGAAVIAAALRQHAKSRLIGLWAAVFALVAFAFLGKPAISARADSVLFFLVALACRGAFQPRGIVWLGICAGLAMGFKATALLYFLPLLPFAAWRERGFARSACAFLATLLVIAALPFLLPQVSLPNYLYWLRAAGKHGIDGSLFLSNLGVLGFLVVVGLIPRALLDRRIFDLWPTIAALACGAVVALAGAKVGAGQYHLLPLLPVCVLLFVRSVSSMPAPAPSPINLAWRISWLPMSLIAGLVFLSTSAFLQASLFGHNNPKKVSAADVQEALSLVAQHRAEGISIGYGRFDQRASNALAPAALAGAKVLLSDVAVWDMHESGLGIPEATLAAIDACLIPVWLIPKGAEPFVTGGLYDPDKPIFGNLPAHFQNRYLKAESFDRFDLWRCQAEKPG